MSRLRDGHPRPLGGDEVKEIYVAWAAGPGFVRVTMKLKFGSIFMHVFSAHKEHLHLAFSGDRGPWLYDWYGTGRKDWAETLAWAARIDSDYLMRKLGQGRLQDEFDAQATVRNIKDCVIQRRRDGDLTKEEARDVWDSMWRLEGEGEHEIYEFIDNHRDDLGHDDLGDLFVRNPPYDLVFLCYAVWPLFADFIKRGFRQAPAASPGQQQLPGIRF